MMRTLFSILAVLTMLTTACSTTTGKQTDGNNAMAITQETGKVEYLTYDTFLEKVWNFEANQQSWVYEGELPAIIDFYADWCAPCRMIAPIMDKLAEEYKGQLKIYKIDVDKEQKLAAVFQVRSIPSVLFTPVHGKPMMQAGALTEEMYVKVIEEQLLNK